MHDGCARPEVGCTCLLFGAVSAPYCPCASGHTALNESFSSEFPQLANLPRSRSSAGPRARNVGSPARSCSLLRAAGQSFARVFTDFDEACARGEDLAPLFFPGLFSSRRPVRPVYQRRVGFANLGSYSLAHTPRVSPTFLQGVLFCQSTPLQDPLSRCPPFPPMPRPSPPSW